jgi:serine/threonine-protein kinase
MDHRGDLYSVGVILYELLSGRLPFTGKCTMDVLLAHATEEPPPFSECGIGDWVPPATEDVVRQCLTKEPLQRPGSARELAERYEMALAQGYEPTPALPPSSTSWLRNAMAASPPQAETPPPSAATFAQVFDPNTVVHHLEAWMPETIAAYKLRGFVQDAGGEVMESVPGRIKVRLGGKGSVYAHKSSGWLGMGRKNGLIDMELHLERGEAARESQLRITVLLRPVGHASPTDNDWRMRCTQIYCDLRGYLMGQ